MSDFLLVNGMQMELDAVSSRRRSLESDVLQLEHKINVVNRNLKQNTGNTKLMSLMDFLETEKQRIQEKKLKRINEKEKLLRNQINCIRDSQNKSSLSDNKERKPSQLTANEKLINSKEYYSRPKSIQLSTINYSFTNRKYQSLPISRPHTTNGDSETFTIQSDQQDKGSKTHLPMCMSMNVCQECTAIRNFFLNMKNEKEISISPCNISDKSVDSQIINKYAYDSTILSIDSNQNQMQHCMRCKAAINEGNDKSIVNDYRMAILTCESSAKHNHIAKSQPIWTNEENSKEIFEDQLSQKSLGSSKHSIDINPSISASVLATCESYTFCDCCNNNLSKISMPTPSPSIVEIACKSHENCIKCTEALLESARKNNSSSPKILCMQSPHSSESSMSLTEASFKAFKQDDISKILYEEIRKEVENQNQVIFDTKKQISKLLKLDESNEKYIQLKKSFEIENWKLSDMKNLEKIEELKS